MGIASRSVDLGPVECVAAAHRWDRPTNASPVQYYLAKNAPDDDYGEAATGATRRSRIPPVRDGSDSRPILSERKQGPVPGFDLLRR